MATVFKEECLRAQSWVLALSQAIQLDMRKLYGWAMSHDALFGMQIPSRTLVLSLTKAETQQQTLDKLRTMIKHYGGDPAALVAVKPLDVYHLEEWGCIDAYKAPKQPTVSMPESVKSTSESEEEPAPAEEPEEQEEEAVAVYNDRTLATKFEEVAAVRPTVLGSRPPVITADDAERQLDSDLADLTDDDKMHLTILYRPQMLRATAEHIAEECANLPPMETIHWLTRRPEPLVVYKHMPAQRKLQWLLHRARDAEMEKTPEHFPVFLGFFNDLAPIADDEPVEPGAAALAEVDRGADSPEKLAQGAAGHDPPGEPGPCRGVLCQLRAAAAPKEAMGRGVQQGLRQGSLWPAPRAKRELL